MKIQNIIRVNFLLLLISCGKTDGVAPGSIDGKYMFLTASLYDGNLGGASGADAFCQADLNRPNSSTYKAFLVTSSGERRACSTSNCVTGGATEHVDWVLAPSTSYYRTDDSLIGTTNSIGLFIFPLTNSISPTAKTFMTGFQFGGDWIGSGYCSSYTASDLTSNPTSDGTLTTSDTIAHTVTTCNTQVSLLCVEQ